MTNTAHERAFRDKIRDALASASTAEEAVDNVMIAFQALLDDAETMEAMKKDIAEQFTEFLNCPPYDMEANLAAQAAIATLKRMGGDV